MMTMISREAAIKMIESMAGEDDVYGMAMADAADALRSLPAVDGVVVPKEPTEEMWLAFMSCNSESLGYRERFRWEGDYGNFVASYWEMLKAALCDMALRAAEPAQPMTDGTKLWLWKNGDHMLAYANEYPCYEPGGDPMTLGEPVGVAIFRASAPRAVRGESPSNPPTDDTIGTLVDRLIEDVEVVAIIDDRIRSEMRAEWIEKVRSALRGER